MSAVPDKIWLFRMLHWENVEYVLQNGICCREHANADPDYINIGHRQLISDRHTYSVPINGAGELGEYVPFYFAGHSPMLLKIKTGHGSVIQRSQDDIVFIMCDYDVIKQKELSFIFTDRNAKIGLANFYTDPADFDKLHWDIIKAKQWRNDESNMSRQDYKQAEFLIRSHVPTDSIHGLVVKTEARKVHFEQIVKNLGLEIKVYLDNKCKLFY